MIQGINLSEPAYKLFIAASSTYADKVEAVARAVEDEQPDQAKLLRILADQVAQSAMLIVRFWPAGKKECADGFQRPA